MLKWPLKQRACLVAISSSSVGPAVSCTCLRKCFHRDLLLFLKEGVRGSYVAVEDLGKEFRELRPSQG